MCTHLRFLFPLYSCLVFAGISAAAELEVSFSRDIRPLLAKNCLSCHGPDAETREADLRLDTFAGATVDLGGYQAIRPHDPDKSELLDRITSSSPETVMPPPDSGKTLTPEQQELLRRWITEGAQYSEHWAFVPPQSPPVPEVDDQDWKASVIDRFVYRKLREHGLLPSVEADRYQLIRRVSLDLTGLPPTPEETDAFINDTSPAAYEKLVERLLASPRYGERWARRWLDLARYADTNGYEKDRPRSIWPYRDWVIQALNADMPFNEFSIQQLAGDMLPQADAAARVATGFHRNTMLNEEGGIDPLEFRYYSMIDRVATTGTVWLGMTVGCAQCHSHKYDPISHADYYQFMAFLNNADEIDLIVQDPAIEQKQTQIQQQIEKLLADLPQQFPPAVEGGDAASRKLNLQQQFDSWLQEQRQQARHWKTLVPTELTSNSPKLEVLEDGSIFSTGDITKRDLFELTIPLAEAELPMAALRLEVLPDDRLPARGPGRAFYEGRQGDFFLSELQAHVNGEPIQFVEPSHSYGKISIGNGTADAQNVLDGDGSTGWSTANGEGEAHQLVLNLSQPVDTLVHGDRLEKDKSVDTLVHPDRSKQHQRGELKITLLFERHFAASLGRFRLSVASKKAQASVLPVDEEALCLLPAEQLQPEDRERLKQRFLLTTPLLAEARKPLEKLKSQLPEMPTTMIFAERPDDNPRPTHRHHRGEYLQPRDAVEPQIPEMFRNLTERTPSDRLEFAKWLVSAENPLVGRVTVNRAWEAFFGRGLVKTLGDLGTQAELPTHPELLDWLATEFVSPTGDNWSLKALHRKIVLSRTYRQDSTITPAAWKADPENVWLGRGPRVRLDAEVIRDSILAASGLLTQQLGGPSVYPPQPNVVTELAYGNSAWPVSQGTARYRRSLYTFSKRTAPFAAYTVFDAPTGESCIAQRDRSNTPLQALTLLNDDMFIEAARALAKQAMQGQDREQIGRAMFRSVLVRPPAADELTSILAFQSVMSDRLMQAKLKAHEITGQMNTSAELAAWVMTARVLFNLDEAVTKQ